MPPGSVIVNCARGALLDYDAVCAALDSGHLFGAAFDVFPEEPIPAGSPLLTTPNIVMTPHLAGASKETASNAARIIAQDVARYLDGEPLANCANPGVQHPGIHLLETLESLGSKGGRGESLVDRDQGPRAGLGPGRCAAGPPSSVARIPLSSARAPCRPGRTPRADIQGGRV